MVLPILIIRLQVTPILQCFMDNIVSFISGEFVYLPSKPLQTMYLSSFL